MIPYAESSAVLAWILGQPDEEAVFAILSAAPRVCCSALTVFECDRSLARAVATGERTRSDAGRARDLLTSVLPRWEVADISAEALQEARRPFPKEPIRSLDAIHLGTALLLRRDIPGLAVVTLDRRVAENAALLGFEVLPRDPAAR